MSAAKIISERQCSVEWCTNKHEAKGFCEKHYLRYKKYGNPLYCKVKIRKNGCKSYTKNGISYIELTQGKWAKCSPEDLEYLLQWTWHTHYIQNKNYFYPATKNKGRHITMGRAIARRKFGSIPNGKEAEHEDTNPLNNQRSNIRIGTHAQNNYNKKKRRDSSNKYKGVHLRKDRNLYRARIKKNGKQSDRHFKKEKEAALWYNQKAIELFGEFARLNEI